MSIVLARVDNRLVHGQILSAWLPSLGADAVLVLDDEAARNTLMKSAMQLAMPPDAHFAVAALDDAAGAVHRLPSSARSVVLLRDVADALRVVEAGVRFERLNLGNVHFTPGRVAVTQSIFLSPEEVEQLARVEALGVPVELRTLPADAPLPLGEAARRVRGER